MPPEYHYAIFPEAGRCEIRRLPLPAIQPGEALVRIESSLISPGTETVIFTGQHSVLQASNTGWLRFPFTPGYSAAGRVLEVGGGVQTVKPGDRVFLPAPHATHAVMAAEKLLLIPAGVSMEEATFAELGAIALNGVRQARIGLNDSVVIAGLGLVGLLTARLAKLTGAMPLLASDPAEGRRALGTAFGADEVFDPLVESVAEKVSAATGERMADIVIEATGVPRVVLECLSWTRGHATVVLLGAAHGKVEVNFYTEIVGRNLQLIGAHVGGSNHPSIGVAPWSVERNRLAFLERVARGDIDVKALITQRIAPGEMEAAYRSIVAAPTQHLGTVVDWTALGGDLVK